MHHQVLHPHPFAHGGDPHGTRSLATLDREREAEDPAITVFAEQIDGPSVHRDARDEPRLSERGEAIEAQRPLAVKKREVVEVHATDQKPR